MSWIILISFCLKESVLYMCDSDIDFAISFYDFSWLNTGFVTRVTRQVSQVKQELLTFPEYQSSPSVLSGVHISRSLVLCVMFCRSLFVLLYFFFWPLCCLSFFDLRILITPLVSSNSSSIRFWNWSSSAVFNCYILVPHFNQ